MRCFLIGPVQETLAQAFKKMLQRGGLMALAEHGFFLAADVEIHQGHLDVGQAQLLAHQAGINFGLGPMQLAVVVGLAFQVATVRLDFFEPIAVRVIAIGAATHLQVLEAALQGHFALVVCSAPRRDLGMPRHALQAGRRRRETQVQITLFGAELAQGAHGHRVGQRGAWNIWHGG